MVMSSARGWATRLRRCRMATVLSVSAVYQPQGIGFQARLEDRVEAPSLDGLHLGERGVVEGEHLDEGQ